MFGVLLVALHAHGQISYTVASTAAITRIHDVQGNEGSMRRARAAAATPSPD